MCASHDFLRHVKDNRPKMKRAQRAAQRFPCALTALAEIVDAGRPHFSVVAFH